MEHVFSRPWVFASKGQGRGACLVGSRFGEGFMAIHRVDLHNELLKLALERTDNPALLRLGIAAEDVDAIDGSLLLSDGTKCQADLIVAADGTHSAIRRSVLKSVEQPAMTDMSAFRFLVPTNKIEDERSLCELYKWKSSGTTVFVDNSDKAVERHLMLPFGGQAANQAIEDGGALGVLLSDVNDNTEIPQRIRVFESVKKDRTSIIQILSSVRIGRENEVKEKLRSFAHSESEIPTTFNERIEYAFRLV
ncbi:MAG: hypothetical protein LQ351_007417 [Letrouitia transgressa]|nr:MAG: hypothetical protein LQ351_007417 [Letrouitia transgressa]